MNAKRTNKRDDIVSAAIGLLSRVGSDGFSAAALAEAAGVSKANLFHHFDSLDAIVLEAFAQLALGMEMLRPPQGITLRGWLQQMGHSSFGLDEIGADMTRSYFVFMAKALFNETLRAQLLGTVNIAVAAIADILSDLCRDEMSRAEVESLANLIFVTVDGMILHLLAFPERRPFVAAAWAEFVDRVAPEIKEKGTEP